MKKITALLLTIGMCAGVTACGNEQAGNSTTVESETVGATEAVSESETTESTTEQIESIEESSVEEKSESSETNGTNTLIVYFSATGTTEGIAEYIAEGLRADIYEIIPEEPYTDADLDYGDNNSRSTLEMNDSSIRPAISGSVDNMEQYDTIYIGYPIWWGEAPRIVDTFVESYDFTDKTVIPFCTSASSGMGSSASGLESLAGSGNWLSGQRFSGNESAETVMEWVNQF